MIGAVPDTAAIIASRDRFERNDRLPLPHRDGLYLLTGLGGRGLLWSVLGAKSSLPEPTASRPSWTRPARGGRPGALFEAHAAAGRAG